MNRSSTHTTAWLVALALVSACQDRPTAPAPMQHAPATVSKDIVDGVHMGGNSHFYFLPPVVRQPHTTGTFDASLIGSLAVEVCKLDAPTATSSWSCGATVARFTSSSATDALRLVASGHDDEEEGPDDGAFYAVNWHTNHAALQVSGFYRITVLVEKSPLGFADLVVRNKGEEGDDEDHGGIDRTRFFPLVNGRTLPIRFRVEKGAFVRIGPAGGTATALGGLVTVVIPPGALSEPIDVTALPAALPPGTETPIIAGTAVDMGPDGTKFTLPVQLTIRYDPAQLPAGADVSMLKLAKLIDGMWIAMDGTKVDAVAHTVTGVTSSFSTYALTLCRLLFVSCMSPGPDVTVGSGLEKQTVGLVTGSHSGFFATRVTVRSLDPAVALVAPDLTTPGSPTITVNVAAGQPNFSYVVQVLPGAVGRATIIAGGSGLFVGGQMTTTVGEPQYQLTASSSWIPPWTLATTSPPQDVYVEVGIGNSASLVEAQPVIAGGTLLFATLGTDIPGVINLAAHLVAIYPGESRSRAIAVSPVAAGSTHLVADMTTIPPLAATAAANRLVTVRATPVGALNAYEPAILVGGGLQKATYGWRSSGNGPVTVTLEVSDTNVVKLSLGPLAVGSKTISMTLADGQTDFPEYYVQALATSGTATVTTSAPGYTSSVTSVTVVQPSVAPNGGTFPAATAISSSFGFGVSVGISPGNPPGSNAATTGLEVQSVRAGGAPLTVTVTNSDATVAKLLSSTSGTGLCTPAQTTAMQCVTAQIMPGFSSSTPIAPIVDGGLLEFDAVGVGQTTVSASSPGFLSKFSKVVTVTPP